jgi:predicted nuclease of predicted toxin-antitoxin system
LWEFAKQNEFIIVTRDADFNELSWVRRGNCSTNQIEEILQLHLEDIQAFAENSDLGVLTLY